VSGDEPAILEFGPYDRGLVRVMGHDEIVADGGGVFGDDVVEVGGGELKVEEVGF